MDAEYTRVIPTVLLTGASGAIGFRLAPLLTGDGELRCLTRRPETLTRRLPAVRVPVLAPRLSSYWVMLVTPVENDLVRPLVDGLREEMVVRTPPPPGINDAPLDFDAAVRVALEQR